MDGYQVASRLLRAQPGSASLMLVALTGYGQEDDRKRSRQAGFDHHLVKPIDPFDLRNLLARVAPTGHGAPAIPPEARAVSFSREDPHPNPLPEGEGTVFLPLPLGEG